MDKCNNDSYKDASRTESRYFQRNRKLSFPMVCLFILRGCKRGLHAAIRTFLNECGQEVETYSKAAFCKARQKIKPEAFLELVHTVAQTIYSSSSWKTYCGYRVFAIDGSDLNIPFTEENLRYFGAQKSAGKSKQVQALSSGLYDTLNHCFLDARIKPFSASERELAEEHLKYLSEARSEKDLVIMDRGYPSEKLLRSFEEKKLFYLFRCSRRHFFKEIRSISSADEVVTRICSDGTALKFRVIVLILENGTEETLITNIFDEFTTKDFQYLYHLRWGIEEKFNDLKNKLYVESFSGISPIAIEQDFFASICLLNLVATIEMDMEAEIQEKNAHCTREYQLNVAQTVDLLKETLIRLVMEDDPQKQKKLFDKIQNDLLCCVVSSPPGRSFPRNMNAKSSRFFANRKSCGS